MKNRVAVLHGINLGALDRRPGASTTAGSRSPSSSSGSRASRASSGCRSSFFQSNHEGEFVEELHKASDYADGLLLNPGAWTHYAWSLRDAVEISGLPAVEVHLSDVDAREAFRHVSVLEDVRVGKVVGQGRRRLPRGAGAAEGGVRREPGGPGRGAAGGRRRAARHRAGEPALRDRASPAPTASRSSGRDVRRFVTDFRYVEQAKVEVAGLRPRAGAAGAARGAGRASTAWRLGLRRRAPVGARRTGGSASCCRRRRARARGGRRRGRARGQGAGRDRCASAPPPRWSTRSTRGCWSSGWSGAPSATVAVALEHEMRLRGASGPSFPSIVASAEHGALPHAQPRDVAIAARHAGHARHRRGAGRLLLGLHAHVGDGRSVSDELAEIYALVLRAQVTALDAVAARARWGARSTRSRATSSPPPATASTSATASGTASGSSPTRRRGWRARPRRALVAGQRRDGRAGRLPAGRRRRADRGSRGGHRERPRRPLADHERAPDRRIGSSPHRRRLKRGRWAADIRESMDTSTPHPPPAAPRRRRGRARRARRARRGGRGRPRRR